MARFGTILKIRKGLLFVDYPVFLS